MHEERSLIFPLVLGLLSVAVSKDTATELDFNELDMVSGGSCFDSLVGAVRKTTNIVKDVFDWFFD